MCCMVCTQWELGKMTKKEVDRALTELITDISSDEELLHVQEVLEKVKE